MQEINHLFKCIHIKRRLVKKSHSTSQLATSLSVASKLRLMILSSQNSFHKNLVHSHYSNPKSLFKHLCFLSSPDKLPQVMIPLLFINLVTKLNYSTDFSSVFSTSDFVLPPIDEHPTPQSELSDFQIDSSDVFNALHSLDPSKGIGCDNISPYILKFCSSSLTASIT